MAKPRIEKAVDGIRVVTVDLGDDRLCFDWTFAYTEGVLEAIRAYNDEHGTNFRIEFKHRVGTRDDAILVFKPVVHSDDQELEDGLLDGWLRAGLKCTRRAKLNAVTTLAPDRRSGTVEYSSFLVGTPRFDVEGVNVRHDTESKTVRVTSINQTFGDVTKAHLKAVRSALQRQVLWA